MPTRLRTNEPAAHRLFVPDQIFTVPALQKISYGSDPESSAWYQESSLTSELIIARLAPLYTGQVVQASDAEGSSLKGLSLATQHSPLLFHEIATDNPSHLTQASAHRDARHLAFSDSFQAQLS